MQISYAALVRADLREGLKPCTCGVEAVKLFAWRARLVDEIPRDHKYHTSGITDDGTPCMDAVSASLVCGHTMTLYGIGSASKWNPYMHSLLCLLH